MWTVAAYRARMHGFGSAVHIRGCQCTADVAVRGAAEIGHQLETFSAYFGLGWKRGVVKGFGNMSPTPRTLASGSEEVLYKGVGM